MKILLSKFYRVIFAFFILCLSPGFSDFYRYDPEKRVEVWTLTEEKTVECRYDFLGKRLSWKDWDGTTEYRYDKEGHLKEVTTPSGEKIFYAFDQQGNLQKIISPSKETVSYYYGPGSVLESVSVRGLNIFFTQDIDSNLPLKKELPNRITTEYRYDLARRVSDIIHKHLDKGLIAHFHFDYDNMGNRTYVSKKTPFGEKSVKYGYDKLYRLVDVFYSNGAFEKYTYDQFGNRLTKETGKGLVSYDYQEGSISTDQVTYLYDLEGNLAQKITPQGTSEYLFNELGQLIRYKDRKYEIEFTYNGRGERLKKTVNGLTTDYTYESVFPVYQLLEEKKEGSLKNYFYAERVLGYTQDDKIYYYLENSPGNPVGIIVDENGDVVQELDYGSFGENIGFSQESVQYSGEQVDPETGLIFLRTRYYDPELGRFISQDRVPGDLRHPQSLNRYSYANNNPIGFYDPLGTTAQPKEASPPIYSWAKGVPIVQEGDPPLPEGMVLLVICSRDSSLKDRRPGKKPGRKLTSVMGHAWTEVYDGKGGKKSVSVHKEWNEDEKKCLCSNDATEYAKDPDTIRIAYLVPEDVGQKAVQAVEDFSGREYGFWRHNCVHATTTAAKAANLDLEMSGRCPGGTYQQIERRIKMGVFGEEKILKYEQALRDASRISEVPVKPLLRSEFERARQLEKEAVEFLKNNSFEIPNLQRGNFGGISLSKKAELKLWLKDIKGAVFDPVSQQLILVGERSVTFPTMKLDDLAVAIQSIYGLKGKKPEDPGISLEPYGEDKMKAIYSGSIFGTEFGRVLYEGDLALKNLLIGNLPCHVPGFLSYKDRLIATNGLPKEHYNRIWLEPQKISLRQTKEGSSMIFEEVKMECFSETKALDGTLLSNPCHDAFAKFFTKNYESIAKEYQVFSEVKRLGEITGIVKWLKDNNIPIDLAFFKDYVPVPCENILEINQTKIEYAYKNGGKGILKGGIYFSSDRFESTETALGNLQTLVMQARPKDDVFSWDVQDDQGKVLSAEAFPLFKTRKTGNFYEKFVDISYPAPGDYPLTFSRYYDSFNDQDVGFGIGWSITPFDLKMPDKVLCKSAENTVFCFPFLLVRQEHQEWIYYPQCSVNGSITYVREDGEQVLQENADHTFSLTLQEGGSAFFSPKGLLSQITDRHGVKTKYAYCANKLCCIYGENKKILFIRYVKGKIAGVYGSKGMSSVFYSYDAKGRLLHVTNGKEILLAHEYDQDHRLIKLSLGSGKVLFEGAYDDYNRLVKNKIGGQTLHRTYNLSERSAVITALNGSQVKSFYDEHYAFIDAKQNLFNSPDPKPKQPQKEEGFIYKKDEKGRVLQATNPLGETWEFVYSQDGDLTLTVDPQRKNTYFEYDASHRLIRKMSPFLIIRQPNSLQVSADPKSTTEYHYNSLGRIEQIIEGGESTRYHYEENGLLVGIDFPSGYKIRREFDEDFRLVRLWDQRGDLKKYIYEKDRTLILVPSGVFQLYHDLEGKIIKIVDALFHETEFFYDEQGSLNGVKDAEGNELHQVAGF